jgi:hypothetical protein
MVDELVLMTHAGLGLLVILACLWVFVEALNVNRSNVARIRWISLFAAVLMWVTFIVAGHWYVAHYATEKALILKGPWPFAHDFYMETKEHLILMVVLLTTFLPLVAWNDLVGNRNLRNLFMCVAGIIVIMAVLVEGSGGIISMGSKLAALPIAALPK